jgi:hypothetical protein
MSLGLSVMYSAVFRIQIRIQSDPDLFDQIRILALINDPIPTFLVCVKAINTLGISVSLLFGS